PVEVLDDDARVGQNQVAVHQGRHAVVGVEIEQILGKAPRLDAHDVDADALLGQHDPCAMTPRVVGREKQRHDGSSARQVSAPAIRLMEAPRGLRPGEVQWTSFQYSRFTTQASPLNPSRNSTTHRPSARRAGSVASPTWART